MLMFALVRGSGILGVFAFYPNGHKISLDPRGHRLGAPRRPTSTERPPDISCRLGCPEPSHPGGIPSPTPYANHDCRTCDEQCLHHRQNTTKVTQLPPNAPKQPQLNTNRTSAETARNEEKKCHGTQDDGTQQGTDQGTSHRTPHGKQQEHNRAHKTAATRDM